MITNLNRKQLIFTECVNRLLFIKNKIETQKMRKVNTKCNFNKFIEFILRATQLLDKLNAFVVHSIVISEALNKIEKQQNANEKIPIC